MQKKMAHKLSIVTVFLVALISVPFLSYAENVTGEEVISQSENKSNVDMVVEGTTYSDKNIALYLGTLKERAKIENPVTKHFVIVRAVAVMAVILGGMVYLVIRYKKRLKN